MGRLPRAVEEQGKRADELLKQFGVSQNPPAANNPPAATPGMTDPPAPVTPAPVVPDSEYVSADQNNFDPNAQTPPAMQTPPEPVTPQPVTPSPVPPDDQNSETWKSRYLVLQGKYNAEVPRLSGRISYLENQVQDLLARPAQPNPDSAATASVPPVATTASFSDMLNTSEDPSLKSFKQNFPDVAEPIGKLFDEFGSRLLKSADEKMAAIEKTSRDTKQATYVRELTQAHADWQTICQGDPQWPIWLNTDNGYGITRLDALRKANANFDSRVVSKLLTDFKKETGLASAQPNNTGSDPRARQVTPSSGPSGTQTVTPQNQGPEPVARSFITQFAIDVTRGKYRGMEKEAEAIQAKIDAAVSAGKVLNK